MLTNDEIKEYRSLCLEAQPVVHEIRKALGDCSAKAAVIALSYALAVTSDGLSVETVMALFKSHRDFFEEQCKKQVPQSEAN